MTDPVQERAASTLNVEITQLLVDVGRRMNFDVESSCGTGFDDPAYVNRYGAGARQLSVRANAVVIVALLLAGCSDDEGVPSGADTTVPTAGPKL